MSKLKLIVFSTFLLSLSCISSKAQTKVKQNIIFILADDLGWKDLACYGSEFYETPNIDALAESGVRFTSSYAASPLCSPTRASILTGQEPGRLRFTTPVGHLEEVVLDPKETSKGPIYFKTATPETCTRLSNEYITFAEVLKEKGYSTAFMGKWHLGRDPYIPENQGFDLVVGGREHPGPPGPGHFFSPWNCETLPVVPDSTHIADVLTEKAIEYMENQKDNPFLLCLWYYDVHAPYQSKNNLKEKYANKLNSDHVQRSPTMGGMIENMDTNIGKVLKKLEELNLDKNTIIIFTSDNGGNMYDVHDGTTATNNYPLRAGKGNNYEGGVRVPHIVKVPGLTKVNTFSKVVTSSVDHYSTLMELLDISVPENQVSDGFSYVKALKGKNYKRAPIYSTFCHNVAATGNRANISMRHGPWRLYKFYFDGPNRGHRYELYNLDNDISESKNLAVEMPERVKKMTDQLDAHVKEAKILLPQKNENYVGNVADAWFGSENTKISVSNRILKIKSNGTNPSIETVYTPSTGTGDFYLNFEMKSSAKGDGEIAWKVAGDKEYLKNNLTKFKTKSNNQWNQYKVEISLAKNLSTIRLQVAGSIGDIEIKNIELVTKDGYYICDWPLYMNH